MHCADLGAVHKTELRLKTEAPWVNENSGTFVFINPKRVEKNMSNFDVLILFVGLFGIMLQLWSIDRKLGKLIGQD